MSDDDFLQRFEAGSFPLKDWHHRAHLKLAYLYLVRYGFDAAAAKLRNGIRAYNNANHIQDTATTGYHETITIFWLHMVAATVQQYGQMATADEFVNFHPQLSQKIHRLFYSAALFMSPLAKQTFVPPDLTQLPGVSGVS